MILNSRFVAIGIAISFFTACSSTVPVNYVASPSIRGEGAVGVGTVRYLPAEKGEVKPNQFQKAVSLGEMYVSENVDDLLKTAIRKELVAAGFDASPDANLKINAEILQFKYDWVGVVEVDFYFDVKYVVSRDSEVVFEDIYKVHKAAPKTVGTDSEAVRSAINTSIDKLFMDLRSKKII